jgi:hypothetical protein
LPGRASRMDVYKVLAVCTVRRGTVNLFQPAGSAGAAFESPMNYLKFR